MSKKALLFLSGVLFVVAAVLRPFLSLQASEKEPVVIKVAFPQVEGFSTTDEYGERQGMVVDYLNEISKYTGWEYEYIDTDGEDITERFLAGEFDIIGGTYYIEGMEEYFSYPDISTGHGKSVLLARWDDPDIRGYELKDLNGKTIGVFARAYENIRRLKGYLALNGIECRLKSYEPEELQDGSLYHILESGEVDLLLGNSSDDNGMFRAVAYFDAQPHYIVTSPDKPEILEKLNWALGRIMESNPDFAEERYQANFVNSVIPGVTLNEEEKAYIQEKQTVTVAVLQDCHPLYCKDNDIYVHNGIMVDILTEITKFCGLQFNCLYAESYTEALEMVQEGEADMLGFFFGSEKDAAELELALTQPYVTMTDLVARNRMVNYPDKGMTAAVVEGRKLPRDIMAEEIKYYPDVLSALSAVNKGEADFIHGISSLIELEMQRHYMPNVVPMSLHNKSSIDIGFAMLKPADSSLLSVINKSLTSLSVEKRVSIADQNMIFLGNSSLTLRDMIYRNPIMFVSVIAAVLLLVIAALAIASHSRVKNAVMRGELERAEADSRTKSEFLSRMSHEIRTPMNAIVGLTELAGVQEELPESVQAILEKLRASSKYLLSLLNDILDMSRIDRGMLNIVNKPFSLRRMLEELQSMMQAETERYGVTLHMHIHIEHENLMGDAVRLQQVLTNLLSNALKFTPAGGKVELRIRENGADASGVDLEFHVSDNGIGISEKDQERVFEVFEQTGHSVCRTQGTGLGLPISKSIVQSMGGELQLHSEEGRGSDFFFSLKFPYGDPVNEPQPEIILGEKALQGIRILLAEDNEINGEIAIGLLEEQGAAVTWAQDGEQAVQIFSQSESGEFRAILMDIQMPVMNGLEAAQAVRALDRADAAVIPIVAMTANTFQEDRDAAAAAGMDGFVPKPLDKEYLYRKIVELTRKRN